MNWSAIAAARCCEEIAEPQLQARRVTKIKAIKWPSPRQPTFKKSAANTKHLVCLLQQNAAHSKQAVHNYLGH